MSQADPTKRSLDHNTMDRLIQRLEGKTVMICPSQTPTEYEATLVVSSERPLEVVQELRMLGAVGGLDLEPKKSVCIHDVYFDTAQKLLSARHHALRLRKTRGEWQVALKGPSSSGRKSVVARSELELAWSRRSLDRINSGLSILDIALDRNEFYADDPQATMLRSGLVAIQDRIVDRAVRNVVAADPRGSTCELVIDTVTYRFHDVGVLHHEVEIEAGSKAGIETVEMLISRLVGRFGQTLRPWSYGKLPTGMAVEELMKRGDLEGTIDVNQCLMPRAYDLIDTYLAGDP